MPTKRLTQAIQTAMANKLKYGIPWAGPVKTPSEIDRLSPKQIRACIRQWNRWCDGEY
ncbi:MAG: hypothetical protein AAFQ61_02170 [Cyanobacteria bacterium J06626_23]